MIDTDILITKPITSVREVAPGVAYMRIIMVNVFFVSHPKENNDWILIDCGMGNCAGKIKKEAANYFGKDNKPRSIILTHGHFDHVGGLSDLANDWDVQVFAHKLEHPYLTGRSSYPPPDPTVGGGIMPLLSPLFKRTPIDLNDRVRNISEGETLPFFPEWKVLFTPGHSPGHISFFREYDRTLIAGDAFVTVKQESAMAIIAQEQKLHGPPSYFTIDWTASEHSVKLLRAYNPI